ncbi:MAG: geranylgeranyl reductase family protein [Polyangia bacterium]
MSWEVIIVGAGPAGSTAAATLAKAGHKVLLVDRADFPRAKACGDAVPPPAMAVLRELDVEPLPFYYPERLVLVAPGGARIAQTARPDFRGGLVPRDQLDHALVRAAERLGAERRRLEVTGTLRDADGRVLGVATSEGELRAPIVIAADGATSAVARSLGVTRRPEPCQSVALRGYIDTPGHGARDLEIHFFDAAQPAYGWFFASGPGEANVGIFLRTSVYKQSGRTLRAWLDEYLQRPELRARTGGAELRDLMSWQLPLFDWDLPRVFDGALLAGDAGAFINPFTGAGIQEAMLTGRAAAVAASQALRSGDTSRAALHRYETLWRAALGREMTLSLRVQRLFTRAPWLMDVTFSLLGPFRGLTYFFGETVFGKA